MKINELELLNCPFCGNKVRIEEGGFYNFDLHIKISCCVSMKGGYLGSINDEAEYFKLQERWNKRTIK